MSNGPQAAQMSRVYPRDPQHSDLLRVSWGNVVDPIDLGTNQDTLENGKIIQVSDFDAFRPGQQIYFYLTVFNGELPVNPAAPYISRVRLKFWWLRTSDDYRAPGGPVPPNAANPLVAIPTWTQNDQTQFGGGTANNNRAAWFPHPKMIDVSEWQTVNPPPAAPPRQSDSIIVDEVFTMDLQNPNDPSYQAIALNQPPPSPANQTKLGRNTVFQLISHGWALGITHQFDVVAGQGSPPSLLIDLTWQTGTL